MQRASTPVLWRGGVHDIFIANYPAHTAFTFVADISLTNESWDRWEPAMQFAADNGDFHQTTFSAWPLIYDARLLKRALSVCRVTWDVSETHPEFASVCHLHYSIEKDGRGVFQQAPKTAKCLAKGLIAARLPHLVEQAEVPTFLSAAEAQFADLVSRFYTGLPLSLICSLCARHLGDNTQASMYAKTELTRNLNPLKQALAHMAVGVAECFTEEE
jgi:hypothetical protein